MNGTQKDPEAFLVQILSKCQFPLENREAKMLWTGCFCYIFTDSLLGTVSEGFTCLLWFLANSSESNTAIIGTWFQKSFDNYFSPSVVSTFNLSWVAAMWTAFKMGHLHVYFWVSFVCILKHSKSGYFLCNTDERCKSFVGWGHQNS